MSFAAAALDVHSRNVRRIGKQLFSVAISHPEKKKHLKQNILLFSFLHLFKVIADPKWICSIHHQRDDDQDLETGHSRVSISRIAKLKENIARIFNG